VFQAPRKKKQKKRKNKKTKKNQIFFSVGSTWAKKGESFSYEKP
jgi:hypothetical protein